MPYIVIIFNSFKQIKRFGNCSHIVIYIMDTGEWMIIILILILVIIGVVIIITLTAIERNETKNSTNIVIIPDPIKNNISNSINSARSVNSNLTNTRTNSSASTNQSTFINPNIFINDNNVMQGEIGSTCGKDTDCRTQNCSNGFCQGHNIITSLEDAYCMINGIPNCTNRYSCQNNKCIPIGNDLSEQCISTNDCQPYYLCINDSNNSNNNKVCKFPDDPNSCTGSTCVKGYQCSGGKCLGQFGSPCITNSECINNCSTQSIVRWKDNKWESYARMPTNVKFERIIATTRLNNDDIWGFDPNNGLYRWKHDDPSQTWIKVLNNNLDKYVNRVNRELRLIDIAIVHSESIYLLYKSIDACHSIVYTLYRLNMLTGSLADSSKLIPVGDYNGIQYTKCGEKFAEIIGIDAIMENGLSVLLIYGRTAKDDRNYYVFSKNGLDSSFEYVGPNNRSGLSPNNIVRFVPNIGNKICQDRLFNYLEFGYDSIAQRISSVAVNNKYPSGGNKNIPINGDLFIYDYATAIVDNKITMYMIALDRKTNKVNLFVVPDVSDGSIYKLPGYVNQDTRVGVTNNATYLYTPGTCS